MALKPPNTNPQKVSVENEKKEMSVVKKDLEESCKNLSTRAVADKTHSLL
jgi:hypothetical protein